MLTAKRRQKKIQTCALCALGRDSQDVIDTANNVCKCAPCVDALRNDLDRAIRRIAKLDGGPSQYGDRRTHITSTRTSDAIRIEARRICSRVTPLAKAIEAAARGIPGLQFAARVETLAASVPMDLKSLNILRKSYPSRCPTRRGIPIATELRKRPRCSPFLAAPAQIGARHLIADANRGRRSIRGCGRRRGGSATLPHKRNPIAATAAIAQQRWRQISPPRFSPPRFQEHERSAGLWHAEWPTLPT